MARRRLHGREVRDAIRALPEVRAALERMWPVLTPAQLLHDLFGSKALLRLAAAKFLSEDEYLSLHRPRRERRRRRALDGQRRGVARRGPHSSARARHASGGSPRTEEIRTYGHIVIDEVQDLTPMQLRMASRRSLNGSMTVVGDIAQATGALAPDDWDDMLAHLPDNRPSRVIGLSVGYRIPSRSWTLGQQGDDGGDAHAAGARQRAHR